jgi:hypothetical protein
MGRLYSCVANAGGEVAGVRQRATAVIHGAFGDPIGTANARSRCYLQQQFGDGLRFGDHQIVPGVDLEVAISVEL